VNVQIEESAIEENVVSVGSPASEESGESVQTEIVEISAVEVQKRETDQVAGEEADPVSPTVDAVVEGVPKVVLGGSGQSPGKGRLASGGMSGTVNLVL